MALNGPIQKRTTSNSNKADKFEIMTVEQLFFYYDLYEMYHS